MLHSAQEKSNNIQNISTESFSFLQRKKKMSEYRIRERIGYFDNDPGVMLGKLMGKIDVNAQSK